jgi:hypothetical protein
MHPTQAIHTEAPDAFFVFYISPKAEGLGNINAALAGLQSDALQMSAFDAVTEGAGHRDGLSRFNGTFK